MEDISLYVWLTLGFFLGFGVTAGALLWVFRRRAQGACAPHEWEAGPDGPLRCARCGMVAGERD
jgi:hypothetical protein